MYVYIYIYIYIYVNISRCVNPTCEVYHWEDWAEVCKLRNQGRSTYAEQAWGEACKQRQRAEAHPLTDNWT